MKSNLFLRVISALVLTPIVLAAIIYGNPAYDILLAVVGSLMALEWEKMITDKNSWIAVCLTLMSCLIVFLTPSDPVWSLIVVPVFAVFLFIKTKQNILLSFGAFYIGIPLLSLMYIAYYTDSGANDLGYSSMYVLWVLFVVWATDTGGYVVGKTVGGPKLCPKISAKKTWSGLLGAIAFSAVTTYVFIIAMSYHNHLQLPMRFLVLSSIGLAIVSQAGDLFESKIKRHLGIKDSGNLIPGHGGIFDRVDGLLFAAPVVALFVLLNNMGVFS